MDGHVHILSFGASLRQFDLFGCKNLDQIRNAISTYARSNPSETSIICKGWIQATTGDDSTAHMLDDLDARPIFINSMDMHSVWCNTAALESLKLNSIPEPPGGTIYRDEDGNPTGLLAESAVVDIVWPYLAQSASSEERMDTLEKAVAAYSAAGYTGLIDMAMDDAVWEVLNRFREKHGGFPFHVAAHWYIPYSDSLDECFNSVDHAAAMRDRYPPSTSRDFCIVGIKIISDGTVDGCTAGLSQPYGGRSDLVAPIWPLEKLAPVIQRADAAGLQCSVHAIGDKSVSSAIDVLSRVGAGSPAGKRHRIEHLELTSPQDAKRLGSLGITASVQPVHSDPALLCAWPSLIGSERFTRAFAYRDFHEGHAPVVFGTDAPTARHLPLANLYNATTRRSALEPNSLNATNPQFALDMATAISSASTTAAYSRFADSWTGSLKAGLQADFIVLDMQWDKERLLEARVCETWYRGKLVNRRRQG